MLKTESLSSVPTAARAREEWTYLPDGRWIQRIVSTNNGSSYYPAYTNRYVWDGLVLLAVLDHTNGLVMSFMRGLDLSGFLQGAGGVGGVLAVNCKTNGTHFCAYDGNGNVTALVSATDGTDSARYEYGPFAEPVRITGHVPKMNPIRFSTQYADDVTGDVKYLLRDYSPTLGRWKSRDPIEEEGGINLLVFTFNNSMGFIDPFGACNINGILQGMAPEWLFDNIGDLVKKQIVKTAAKAGFAAVVDGPLPIGEVVGIGLGLYDGASLFFEIRALKGMSKEALRQICQNLASQMNCLEDPAICAEAQKIIKKHTGHSKSSSR